MKKTEKKSEKAKIFTLTTFILLSEAAQAKRRKAFVSKSSIDPNPISNCTLQKCSIQIQI